jgi:sugar phosphate permease
MKQNAFADLEDWLGQDGNLYGIAGVCILIAFIATWVASESFLVALIVCIFGSWLFGGIPMFLVGIAATLFARRDYDAPDDGSGILPGA